jgi:hypothetical protein
MSKMNKPLANYYHEARAQVKKLKTMQEENKKRAERRAEIIAPVVSSSNSKSRRTQNSLQHELYLYILGS